jgi:hypothetical protein
VRGLNKDEDAVAVVAARRPVEAEESLLLLLLLLLLWCDKEDDEAGEPWPESGFGEGEGTGATASFLAPGSSDEALAAASVPVGARL